MSMFGANFEKCAKCNSDVDAYDKKCTNCGATDFKSWIVYPKWINDDCISINLQSGPGNHRCHANVGIQIYFLSKK